QSDPPRRNLELSHSRRSGPFHARAPQPAGAAAAAASREAVQACREAGRRRRSEKEAGARKEIDDEEAEARCQEAQEVSGLSQILAGQARVRTLLAGSRRAARGTVETAGAVRVPHAAQPQSRPRSVRR